MWWDDKRVEQRFDRCYEKRQPGQCWPWTSYKRGKGYGSFYVSQDQRSVSAHRMALERKLGRPLGKLHARHTCDNPICVNPAHLLAGTPSDNMQDKVRRGRAANGDQRGERNGAAKLSAQQVREIRSLMVFGGPTGKEVAKRYGVSAATVSEIKNGRHWRDQEWAAQRIDPLVRTVRAAAEQEGAK
jgi:hypothetical protein